MISSGGYPWISSERSEDFIEVQARFHKTNRKRDSLSATMTKSPKAPLKTLCFIKCPPCLAAARSRSRKNNTQLFSNTLAPLRYLAREGEEQSLRLATRATSLYTRGGKSVHSEQRVGVFLSITAGLLIHHRRGPPSLAREGISVQISSFEFCR